MTKSDDPLPPGQVATDDFPRFGLGAFAFRFPKHPDFLEIAIRGELDSELVLHREDLDVLPRHEQRSDFHCVTTWTKCGLEWSGVRFRDLHEQIIRPQAGPASDAGLVVLRSQDGYSQSLPLEDMLASDVLLADRLDGEPLDVAHGAPIRVVAPAHYGYKNLKHVKAIEFWRDASHYRFPSPKFMDHPRARVAFEERGNVSAALLRRTYPYLIPPVRWLFATMLTRYEGERARDTKAA